MAPPLDADIPQDAEEALLVLRLAAHRPREDSASLMDLRAPLRQFFALARRERLAPEQVLIRVKRSLGDGRVDDGLSSVPYELRSRIISLAIKLYYADVDGSLDEP